MLLYRLAGSDADQMAPFSWQLCKGHRFLKSRDGYRRGISQTSSPRGIIAGLLAGRIGTDNRNVLEEIVDPLRGQAIDLEIFWPDGAPPPPTLKRNYQSNGQSQTLKICN